MMKAMAHPRRFLNDLLDRIFALVGAVLLAQFPQYFGQYLQRLGGHLEELRLQVAEYEKAAAALGLSLTAYIEEHLQARSEVFLSTGQVIVKLIDRLERMEAAFAALRDASLFNRWWVFTAQADWTIAKQTWNDFTAGVPTTGEGLLYAGAGLLLGWGLFLLLKSLTAVLFQRLFRLRRASRPAP